MKSIIYGLYNGKEHIGIGSPEYLQRLLSEQKMQLVRCLEFNHSEEGREYILGLEQDELHFLLTQKKHENLLLVLYPN